MTATDLTDELGHYCGKTGTPSEHRTTGGRAWCHECSEWCYPDAPCGENRCCTTVSGSVTSYVVEHSERGLVGPFGSEEDAQAWIEVQVRTVRAEGIVEYGISPVTAP